MSDSLPLDQVKGVMLSSRPHPNSVLGAHPAVAIPLRAFVPGGSVASFTPSGLAPSIERKMDRMMLKERVSHRRWKHLLDHRKFLNKVAAMKKRMHDAEEDQKRETETRHKRFYEVQSKFRKLLLSKASKEDLAHTYASPRKGSLEKFSADAEGKALKLAAGINKKTQLNLDSSGENVKDYVVSPVVSSRRKKVKKTRKVKPAWAKTKDQIEEEEMNEKEVEDLLEFVENLDYEKFSNSLEVEKRISTIDDEISELETVVFGTQEEGSVVVPVLHLPERVEERRVVTVEEDEVEYEMGEELPSVDRDEEVKREKEEKETQLAMLKKERRALKVLLKRRRQEEWNAPDRVTRASWAAFREAKILLSQNEGLRQIHSKTSLSRVSKGPSVVTHEANAVGEEDSGKGSMSHRILRDLRKDGREPSLLPYLRRCPAV